MTTGFEVDLTCQVRQIHSEAGCMSAGPARYEHDMKLMRGAVLLGVAKKVYDESRKPENQARIRAAAEKVRERRNRR